MLVFSGLLTQAGDHLFNFHMFFLEPLMLHLLLFATRCWMLQLDEP